MRTLILFVLLVSGSANAQSTIRNSGSFQIHPNASIGFFGNIINDSTFSSTGGDVYLTSTSIQNISGSHDLNISNLHLTNSNSTGVVLTNTNLIVLNSADFSDGILSSSDTAYIRFEDNATVSNASNNSHVDGPIFKVGNEVFVFPVGDSGNYQPLSISAPSSITDAFKAEYVYSNPQSFGSTLDPSIDHLSLCEYWTLDRTIGSSQVVVTLGWNSNSCGVTDPNELVVAKWDSTTWLNKGNGGTTGDFNQGTLFSFTSQSAFGLFTLGSTTTNNPLPVELLSFEVSKQESSVEILWSTATERNFDYFKIEKTINGFDFFEVGRKSGSLNSNAVINYQMTDVQPFDGVSYYRLIQYDIDGKETKTDLLSVDFNDKQLDYVYPNPYSSGPLTLISQNSWSSEPNIQIIGSNGQQITDFDVMFDNENSTILWLNLNYKIHPGIYFIVSNDLVGPLRIIVF